MFNSYIILILHLSFSLEFHNPFLLQCIDFVASRYPRTPINNKLEYVISNYSKTKKYSLLLTYTQEMKTQGILEDRLELLKGISGAFRPGVLTALMGVSGAGKTTLMDVLAGRKTSGYIQGSITISGYPKKQETFARISGYCEQTDIHSPHVTVYESLLYSAWLRLAPEVDSLTRTVPFLNFLPFLLLRAHCSKLKSNDRQMSVAHSNLTPLVEQIQD